MITHATYQSVVDAVLDVAGADLRVVGVVSEEGRGLHEDLRYLRDDVAAEYTEEELDAIAAELLFELWNNDWQGDLFSAGDMHYALHRYEDAVILMCHHGDMAVVVSVEADSDAKPRDVASAVCDSLDSG